MLIPNLPKEYTTYFCKGHYFGYSGKPLVSRLTYPVPEKNLAVNLFQKKLWEKTYF